MKTLILFALVLLPSIAGHAKLVVRVDEPKAVGEKSLVRIGLKNTFKGKIESARATLFLLDDKNKIVGQSTGWVIGGGAKDKPPLPADATATYNFLIRAERKFTTTKLTFSRIVLEGGKLADPFKDFEVEK